MKEGMLTVTSPLLPDLDEFKVMLDEIWQSKWITNNGRFHRLLEQELANYLKVPYVCLFTNGTLPLLTALQALNVRKEVITTPFSFVATAHAIMWNGCKPVFVDIDPKTGNIDPDMIEAAITENTPICGNKNDNAHTVMTFSPSEIAALRSGILGRPIA